jgi:hypothetical protein
MSFTTAEDFSFSEVYALTVILEKIMSSSTRAFHLILAVSGDVSKTQGWKMEHLR